MQTDPETGEQYWLRHVNRSVLSEDGTTVSQFLSCGHLIPLSGRIYNGRLPERRRCFDCTVSPKEKA